MAATQRRRPSQSAAVRVLPLAPPPALLRWAHLGGAVRARSRWIAAALQVVRSMWQGAEALDAKVRARAAAVSSNVRAR